MQKLKTFPASPDLDAIIADIDPVRYGKSRNFLNGAVTRLSPYISRGVISTKKVMDHVLRDGYRPYIHEKFIQQLAWREFFQRVLQERPGLHEHDLKQGQGYRVGGSGVPRAVVEGRTGIEGVDAALAGLYETGWMHNHARMYVSSIVANIGGCRWQDGAKWMYYHLLDADVASNGCSWQWICGSFSSKLYYANQENINKYCGTSQRNTFLDRSYEALPLMDMPEVLRERVELKLQTALPVGAEAVIDGSKPTAIYNFYNLDPHWHKGEDINRVLLLEPSHFERYPVSPKLMQFMMDLASNIPGIQVHVGEFAQFRSACSPGMVFYKEHPIFRYEGVEEEREWMFPEVKGFYPSFFSYWKKCQRYLR